MKNFSMAKIKDKKTEWKNIWNMYNRYGVNICKNYYILRKSAHSRKMGKTWPELQEEISKHSTNLWKDV